MKKHTAPPITGSRGPVFETHMVVSTDLQHENAQ